MKEPMSDRSHDGLFVTKETLSAPSFYIRPSGMSTRTLQPACSPALALSLGITPIWRR